MSNTLVSASRRGDDEVQCTGGEQRLQQPSPSRRQQRRGRARNASTKLKSDGFFVADASPDKASSQSAAAPVVVKEATTPSTPSAAHKSLQLQRTVARWQRKTSGNPAADALAAAPHSSSSSSSSSHGAIDARSGVSVMRLQSGDSAAAAARLPPPPPFPPVLLPPWCRSASATAYPLSEDGLTNELVDLFHYLELTEEEAAARQRLLRCVEESVRELWSGGTSGLGQGEDRAAPSTRDGEGETGAAAQVALYGSYALGLSLPSSDIDLVLTFPAEERAAAAAERGLGDEGDASSPAAVEAAKKRQLRRLERLHDLADHLRRRRPGISSAALEVEVYDQCRVPRIHLRDLAADGVSCDINSSLSTARVATIVSRQQRWLADSPLAAFLVRVTKAAVKQWDLNAVFAGGLASTALYCLVLRFLSQAEQLHRHARLEEENLSPPRYDEATQSASSLSASLSGSPLSPSSPVAASLPVHSPWRAAVTQTSATAASLATSKIAAADTIPTYVPTWAQRSKKFAAAAAAVSAVSTTPPSLVAAAEAAVRSGAAADCEASLASVPEACSVAPWESASHSGAHSTCNNHVDDDDEVDALTQEALTRNSCATTTGANTPTSRTATSTPPSPPPPNASSCFSATGTQEKKVGPAAAPVHKDSFPTADELTRMAQTRYGASPARLLLKLWRSLSADAFLGGYQVADAFGNDAVWVTSELERGSGKPPTLPATAALELATYASHSGSDLSAASFRIPDLLALFRCSSSSLDNMLRYQRYPRRVAPTMLSTIFVDPRQKF